MKSLFDCEFHLKKLFDKKTPPSLSGERGFIVLGLMLIPLLLGGLLLWADTEELIGRERHLQNRCRDHLLYLQAENAKGIQRLLALNTPVRMGKLRMAQLNVVLTSALATGNIPLAARLGVQIAQTHRQLSLLGRQQKALLAWGRIENTRRLRKLQRELRSPSSGPFEARFAVPLTASWAVESHGSPYPEYRLKKEFRKAQAIQVRWTWTWQQGETRSFLIFHKKPATRFKKSLTCGTTLVQRGNDLQPRIHEDRSLSSWF